VRFDIKGLTSPLLIGKDAADEKRVYVRFDDSRDVYVIPDDLLRMVSGPARIPATGCPSAFDHSPGEPDIDPARVGEIGLQREGGGWVVVKPLSARASSAAVEAFLEKLFRTRIEGFESVSDASSFGLSEPVAEVAAFGEGESVPGDDPHRGDFARKVPMFRDCSEECDRAPPCRDHGSSFSGSDHVPGCGDRPDQPRHRGPDSDFFPGKDL